MPLPGYLFSPDKTKKAPFSEPPGTRDIFHCPVKCVLKDLGAYFFRQLTVHPEDSGIILSVAGGNASAALSSFLHFEYPDFTICPPYSHLMLQIYHRLRDQARKVFPVFISEAVHSQAVSLPFFQKCIHMPKAFLHMENRIPRAKYP